MPRVVRSCVAAWIVLHALAVVSVASASGGLQAEVERTIRSTPLKNATVGVSIRNADSRTSLVSVGASRPMIPASNMKLLTTGAAMHVLGADFHFITRLLRDGDRLIVVGDGDPAFGDPTLLEMTTVDGQTGISVEQFLKLWVDPVVAAGLKNVSEIIVDDRIFDRDFVHSGWPVDQLNRRYCAQVSGFNFHLNVLDFYPRPTSSGKPDITNMQPRAPWLEVGNSATCKAGKDDANTAWVARQLGTNNMRMYGNVKFEYKISVPVTLHDMPSFFARLLADRLSKSGVRVVSHRVAAIEEAPFSGTELGPVITTPISTAVARCNRDSHNLYAEALLKRAGAAMTRQPGSWTNGAAIIRHAVHERLGSPSLAGSVVVADGSGLARDNRVSPETLTAWLNTFHSDRKLGPIFIDSLATPGNNGTLRNRFQGANLHGATIQAKSGYINEVSCLSGYVTMPDGRRRSFSVMVNDVEPSVLRHARELQEKIVLLIAKDMAATTVQLGSD